MAMNLPSGGGSGEPGVMMDINTTPLIDVMLVLLVMLIITIPIQRHEVNLDMPVGAPPSLATPVGTWSTINVDFDGTISWNNQAVPDQATLERNLRAGRDGDAAAGGSCAPEQARLVQARGRDFSPPLDGWTHQDRARRERAVVKARAGGA
jgi:biopolymer transport protein ExbD